MSLSTEMDKSVSSLRVLIDIDNADDTWSGRYSFDSFTPVGSSEFYDGRLESAPSIAIARDSNYFGLLTFSSSMIRLLNADGEFDDLFDTHNVIGSTVRIYVGYADLDISEYANLYTGYVESGSVNEDILELSVGDLKKKLGTYNTQDLKFVNAIQGIEDILDGTYGSAANVYASAWSVAKTLSASTATIFRTHPAVDTVSQAIQDCAKSTMGFFSITGDGKYSYKLLDTTATADSTIVHADILGPITVEYSDNTILGSTKVESPAFGFSTDTEVLIPGVALYSDCAYTNGTFIIPTVTTTGPTTIYYRSSDDGNTWNPTTPLAAVAICRLYLTAEDDLMHCDVHSMYRSTDRASSWTAVATLGAGHFSAGQITETEDGHILTAITAATGTTYIARAGNRTASTYSYVSAGIPNATQAFLCSSVQTDDEIIIGSAGSNIIAAVTVASGSSYITQIMRSQDNGSTWTAMQTISRTSNSIASTVKAISDQHWIVGITNSTIATSEPVGEMYYSEDHGSSWSSIQAFSASVFGIHLTGQNILYASCYPYKNIIHTSQPDAYGIPGKVWLPTYQINAPYMAYSDDSNWAIAIGRANPGISTSLSVYRSKVDDYIAIDTTYQASTFSALGIDATRYFGTVLAYNADAVTLANKLAKYYSECHGTFSVTVPMKYYSLGIGDLVNVEIWRETTSMLGTKKCEVMGVRYDLGSGSIQFDMRIV